MSTESYETIVGPVRLSFPHIKEPSGPDDHGNYWYDAVFLEPHDGQLPDVAVARSRKSIEALKDLMRKFAKDTWGSEIPKGVKKEVLALKSGWPIADQDEKEGKYDGYEEGYVYFSAKSKNKIGVVQGNKQLPGYGKVIDPEDLDELIYPGVWVNVNVRLYNTNKKSDSKLTTGIGLGLQAIQFLKLDENIGGGGAVDAEEVDFGDELDDDFFGDGSEDLVG